MAWNTPRHACGHDGERIQLYGNHRGRAYRLEQIERYPCPACRAAEAQAATPDLPELTGSTKQIAWAGEIRAGGLSDPDDTLASTGLPDAEIPFAREALAELREKREARFWIDTRGGFSRWIRERAAVLRRKAELRAQAEREAA